MRLVRNLAVAPGVPAPARGCSPSCRPGPLPAPALPPAFDGADRDGPDDRAGERQRRAASRARSGAASAAQWFRDKLALYGLPASTRTVWREDVPGVGEVELRNLAVGRRGHARRGRSSSLLIETTTGRARARTTTRAGRPRSSSSPARTRRRARPSRRARRSTRSSSSRPTPARTASLGAARFADALAARAPGRRRRLARRPRRAAPTRGSSLRSRRPLAAAGARPHGGRAHRGADGTEPAQPGLLASARLARAARSATASRRRCSRRGDPRAPHHDRARRRHARRGGDELGGPRRAPARAARPRRPRRCSASLDARRRAPRRRRTARSSSATAPSAAGRSSSSCSPRSCRSSRRTLDLLSRCRRRRLPLAPAWRRASRRGSGVWLVLVVAPRPGGAWPARFRPSRACRRRPTSRRSTPGRSALVALGVAGRGARLAPRAGATGPEARARRRRRSSAAYAVAFVGARSSLRPRRRSSHPTASLFVLPSLYAWLLLPQLRAAPGWVTDVAFGLG